MNEFEVAEAWIAGCNRAPRPDNVVRVECREQGLPVQMATRRPSRLIFYQAKGS